MKTNSEEIKLFYQNIGKVLYAVAAADNIVRKEEVAILKKIVREEWLSVDDYKDEFGTDAAYQIEIIFDWLTFQDIDPAKCISDFKFFKRSHEHLFNNTVKMLIWQTATAIANAFSGKNKSELVTLSEISIVLQEEQEL